MHHIDLSKAALKDYFKSSGDNYGYLDISTQNGGQQVLTFVKVDNSARYPQGKDLANNPKDSNVTVLASEYLVKNFDSFICSSEDAQKFYDRFRWSTNYVKKRTFFDHLFHKNSRKSINDLASLLLFKKADPNLNGEKRNHAVLAHRNMAKIFKATISKQHYLLYADENGRLYKTSWWNIPGRLKVLTHQKETRKVIAKTFRTMVKKLNSTRNPDQLLIYNQVAERCFSIPHTRCPLMHGVSLNKNLRDITKTSGENHHVWIYSLFHDFLPLFLKKYEKDEEVSTAGTKLIEASKEHHELWENIKNNNFVTEILSDVRRDVYTA